MVVSRTSETIAMQGFQTLLLFVWCQTQVISINIKIHYHMIKVVSSICCSNVHVWISFGSLKVTLGCSRLLNCLIPWEDTRSAMSAGISIASTIPMMLSKAWRRSSILIWISVFASGATSENLLAAWNSKLYYWPQRSPALFKLLNCKSHE